jgi:accessory colonization factor AcfC
LSFVAFANWKSGKTNAASQRLGEGWWSLLKSIDAFGSWCKWKQSFTDFQDTMYKIQQMCIWYNDNLAYSKEVFSV